MKTLVEIIWISKIGYFPDIFVGFRDGSDVKESTSNAGDSGSIPGLGRSPGEESGSPLPYFSRKI